MCSYSLDLRLSSSVSAFLYEAHYNNSTVATVSEQFPNGTSALYTLLSAIKLDKDDIRREPTKKCKTKAVELT